MKMSMHTRLEIIRALAANYGQNGATLLADAKQIGEWVEAGNGADIRDASSGNAARTRIEDVLKESIQSTPASKALLASLADGKQEQVPKAEPEATTSSVKPDESPAAGAADECSYDDLKKSIMKLVAIDPKHMREIADSFGVKTFQGTTADVWPKAKKAVDDKIVALRG